jgi:hypothetical protein
LTHFGAVLPGRVARAFPREHTMAEVHWARFGVASNSA